MFRATARKTTILIAAVICILFSGSAFAESLFSAMNVIEPKIRVEAPPFTLKTVDGETRDLGQFRGKVILLNFWATWCAPCRDEMPALERLEKSFEGKNLVVVAVAADRGKKAMHTVKDYCRMHDIGFTVFLDPDGSVRDTYEVSALPTSYIIGKDGKFLGKIFGARDWAAPASLKLFESLLKY